MDTKPLWSLTLVATVALFAAVYAADPEPREGERDHEITEEESRAVADLVENSPTLATAGPVPNVASKRRTFTPQPLPAPSVVKTNKPKEAL